MKTKFSIFSIIMAALFISLVAAAFIPVMAAQDKLLTVEQTNALTGSVNYTPAIDLGAAENPDAWALGYIKASIPALPNATNSATTNLFTLQQSTNNSTWVNTQPLVQGWIVGATSATNTATTIKLPLPPDVSRYIRIAQTVPTGAGTNTTVTNRYTLTR